MKDNVTRRKDYINRREFIERYASLGLISALTVQPGGAFSQDLLPADITPQAKAMSYNNYHEFSTNKEAVKILAQSLTISPWKIECSGLCENPITLTPVDLQSRQSEYVYRFRCVEGWSMVVPWLGIPLRSIIESLKPTSASFVKFTSLYRPSEMIGQRNSGRMSWPYVEGLRLDEALHPLTILATGMYGQPLPKQNGAPVRLIVPWKYGFKSIKAITKIELVNEQPVSAWEALAPSEYGFYANVNPEVSHPRWSQRREVRLGEIKKRRTAMFNGYEREVSALYAGMDLEKNF